MKRSKLTVLLMSCLLVNSSIAVNKPSWVTANTNETNVQQEQPPSFVAQQEQPPVNSSQQQIPKKDEAPIATISPTDQQEKPAVTISEKKTTQTQPWLKANTNNTNTTTSDNNNNNQTNFGSSDYVIPNNTKSSTPNYDDEMDDFDDDNVNGVRSLPPLAPPVEYNISTYDQAKEMVSPLSPNDTKKLKQYYDETRAAKYYQPTNTIPKISSVTVDLSAGAPLPVLRTMPNETSTLVFIDSTGAPWPLAAIPRVSNPEAFDVEWLADSSAVIVSARNSFQKGNLTVFLHVLPTPVVRRLVTNEEPRGKAKIVDYRLDVRVAGRGPNAGESIVGDNKIGLYDDVIQNFLDGLPPHDSVKIKFSGKPSLPVQIWKYKGALFVRTSLNLQNAFDQIISSGDGTKVYKIIETPFVTLSDGDKKTVLELEI